MKKILPILLAFLCCYGVSYGQMTGVTVEEIVHDGSIPELTGLTTYRVYVNTVSSTDFVSGVSGGESFPLEITSTGSTGVTPFYKHPAHGSNLLEGINTVLIGFVGEALSYSSGATIGRIDDSNLGIQLSQDMDGTVNGKTAPGFGTSGVVLFSNATDTWPSDLTAGNNVLINSFDGGAWAALNGGFEQTSSAQGYGLGPDNSVLVGQFTTDGEFSFNLNTIILRNFIDEDGDSDNELFEYFWNVDAGLGLTFPSMEMDGCTDPNACNFEPLATNDDGSCLSFDACGICGGDDSACTGCTDIDACNYDPEAIVNEGCDFDSCAGCTNPEACNFDDSATLDDDSCVILDAGFISANGAPTTICAGDGIDDLMSLTGTPPVGPNVLYVVTEEDGTILLTQDSPDFNFESAGSGVCVVWRLVFADDADLNVTNAADLPECTDLSNSITVTREAAGCTNPDADNFDPNACGDDGSCEISAVSGCTEATACNFNPDATENDGSCEFSIGGTLSTDSSLETCSGDGIDDIVAVTVSGNEGANSLYVITEEDGTILGGNATGEFNVEGAGAGTCLVWHLSYADGVDVSVANANDLEGCYDLSDPIEVVRSEAGCTDATAANFNPDACSDDGSCVFDAVLGCTEATACNFNPDATENDGSCEFSIGGTLSTDSSLETCSGDGIDDIVAVTVSGNEGANSLYVITEEDGTILGGNATGEFNVEGAGAGTCLVWHLSYADGVDVSVANANDLEGCYDLSDPIEVVRSEAGCTDATAANFNPDACSDDGSCVFDAVLGCTEATACNFNPDATENDGSCEFSIGGTLSTDSSLETCSGDGLDDVVTVSVSGNEGANSLFVITDDELNILGSNTDGIFNLEGAGAGTCLIWHLSFDDAAGVDVSNAGDLSGCFDLSNSIAVVRSEAGCTDQAANNFNADACSDDGSCTYDTDCVLVCPSDLLLECGSDTSLGSTGTPFYQGECNFAGFEDWPFEDAVSGDACVTVIERTFFGFDGLTCTQTITLTDSEGPLFPEVADIDVECLEDVPAPMMLTAVDACTGEEIPADDFTNTGMPTIVCELSTAFGPGDDWAVWLQGFSEGASDNFVWDENGGNFDQYADGTAHLYGTVVNDTDASQGWIVDLWFENGVDWADWTAQGRWYKDDLGFGEDHFEDWTYYEMTSFSTLTGIGSFDGDELLLTHKPDDFFFGFQCGIGANNKNANEGFSGWFYYEGNVGGVPVSGNGDVNVDKECGPNDDVPECPNDTQVTYLYRATDACGNSTVVTQVITVSDETAPVFVDPPADITLQCQEWPIPFPECVAVDNCEGEITYTDNEITVPGTCPNEFIIRRTWTATDECNNMAEHIQDITVVDEEAPVITCPADMTHECDESPDYGMATATDNCTDLPSVVVMETETGDGCERIITRVFTATDECGNESSCTQTITIVDTTAPVFGDFTPYLSVECDELDSVEEAIEVSDNCNDYTLTYTDVLNSGGCLGVLERTYTATDVCGNSSSITQYISLQDTTAPEIECPEDATYECDQEIPEADENSVAVSDNCGLDVTVEFEETMTGDICETIITRTWIATDYCDNETVCTQTIRVVDTTDPVLVIPPDMTFECDAVGDFGEASATDNCAPEVQIEVTPEETEGVCEAEIVITRTFRAYDECGNSSIAVQTITIVDTTAPILTIPEDLSYECDAVGDFGDASATDNCSEFEINMTMTDDEGDCVRTITRTFVATDACGNASEPQTQTITIVDTTAPILTIPADLSFECDAIGEFGEATSVDACNESSVTMTMTDDNDNCVRTITRTFIATDICGNASEPQTQTITIVDTTAPVITGPASVDMPCDAVDQNILVSVEDACNEYTLTFTDSDVSGGCSGEIIRTYVATDACGNASEFVQILDLFDDVAPVINCPADFTVECTDDYVFGEPTATDNCSDVTITSVDSQSGDSCEMLMTRTWTAVDECGNESSCSQTVTIVDTVAPTLTIPADLSFECDAIGEYGEATAQDACNEWSISMTMTDDDGDCVRTITRTFVATDICGNASAPQTQTITIVDTTAPILTIPADLSFECDAIGEFGEATSTDACNESSVLMTMTDDEGDCVRTITRTFVAVDACDNASDPQTQTITIVDTTAPVITGPASVDMPCDEIDENILVDVTDACNEWTITYSDDEVSGGCAGEVIRTYVATDLCGNSSEFIQILDLIDDEAPELVCPADFTVECTDDYEFGEPMVSDNCGDVTVTSVDSESGDSCEMLMTRTWTAVDECGNESTCSQTVTIVDTVAPELTIPGDLTYECDAIGVYGEASAEDACNEWSISMTMTDDEGDCVRTITRTFVATDACGNASEPQTQTITIVDTTAPILTIPADLSFECDAIGEFGEATSVDSCNDSSVMMTTTDDEDACVRTITRTFVAVDICGNESEPQTQTITIVDTTAPVIEGLLALDMPCDDIDDNILVTATDNCNPENIEITYEQVFVSGGCVGQVIRTYVATDICGNVSEEFVQIIDLTDDEAPELVCPADFTVECTEDYTFGEPTVSDNCTEVTVTSVDSQSGDSCEMLMTRTWTAVDECGNESSCSQTVTIVDTVAPELTIPGDLTYECDAIGEFGEASAEDACNEWSISMTMTDDEGDCVRTITRTFVATDACGNASAPQTQTITIVDTTAPELTIPADLSYECDAIGEYGEATATDNCNEWSISMTTTDDEGDCVRTITRTFVATDACGNASAPQTQTITIVDTTAPELTIPADLSFECDAIGAYGEASAEDACNEWSISMTMTDDEGDCVRTITRTFVAVDVCGNASAPQTQTITVVDTTAPELTIPADLTFECDAVGEFGEATATDNCNDWTITMTMTDDEADCVRTITRTFVAVDVCGNASAPQTQTITVVDTTAPELTIPADLTFECDAVGEFGEATATDNCNDWTITMTMTDDEADCVRTITRTFVAVDVCGNASAPQTQTITVVDTTAPILTIPADLSFECDAIGEFGEASSEDACNDSSVTMTMTDDNDACERTITRTFVAVDACGNESEPQTQTITIVDTTDPEFVSVPADMSFECLSEVPALENLEATDNCQTPEVTCTEVMDLDDCGNGVIIRECTATDGCGNSTTVSYEINVLDTTDPEFTSLPPSVVLDCEDEVPAAEMLGAIDNCDDDVDVTYTEVIIGDAPAEGSVRDCVLSNPEGEICHNDPSWSMKLFDFPGFEFFVNDYANFVEYEDDEGILTAHLTGRVRALNNPDAYFDIDVHFENGLGWDDWSNQLFQTSFKDDCETAEDTEEYENWTYYIMSAGNATLTGGGDLAGSFFELTHAPQNFFYGYQVGVGANNVNDQYGNGGWFFGTGTLVDASTQTEISLEGFQGDFAFDADCCPQYSIERTWVATDCSGNSTTYTQTITFDDLGDDEEVAETQEHEVVFETVEGDLFIGQVYPNPVADKATINYGVAKTSNVTLDVVDMNGNLIATLYAGTAEAGMTYQEIFDASAIESGVYMVRLTGDSSAKFERIVVAK